MCSCLFIEMNQTAHISLQIPSISNSVETKSTGSAPLLCGATRVKSLQCFFASLPSGASLPQSVWPAVVRLSAAGEGVFTDRAGCPQGLFSASRHLFFKYFNYRFKT